MALTRKLCMIWAEIHSSAHEGGEEEGEGCRQSVILPQGRVSLLAFHAVHSCALESAPMLT